MTISAFKRGVSGLKVMTQQIEILNKTFTFAIEKLDNKFSSNDRISLQFYNTEVGRYKITVVITFITFRAHGSARCQMYQ